MYVNGHAGLEQSAVATPVMAGSAQDTGVAQGAFTLERVREIRTQLLEPFDPAEIKWRVTGDCDAAGQTWSSETRPIGGVCGSACVHGPLE
jgi:hypothetical protein